MADNRNRGHTWVAGAGFLVLTFNSVLAIYRARDDAAAVAFVAASYLTLLLLFGALREYERAPAGSPGRARARRAVWPLTTLLTLTLGVVSCDLALAIHKARSENDPGSAACVLVTYGALLALVWLLVREFAGHAHEVVGYGQDHQGPSRGGAGAVVDGAH